MKCTTIFLFLILSAILNLGLFSQTIRYVKPIAEGSGDGSSWNNASSDLQFVINQSVYNDEVWIAAGTYVPGGGDSRFSMFTIPGGIKLFGGFTGTETSINDRDPLKNVTILSGDIGNEGEKIDNIMQIIGIFNNQQNPQIDGITIQGAHCISYLRINEPASVSGDFLFTTASFGNFVYSLVAEVQVGDPIEGCTPLSDLSGKIALIRRGTCPFVAKALAAQNAGALAVLIYNNVPDPMPQLGGNDPSIVIPVLGISQADGESILNEINSGKPVVVNMGSGNSGGGMVIIESNVTINNCKFMGNSAQGGSSILLYLSNASITNSHFLHETSYSGTIMCDSSNLLLSNCDFENNSSRTGGGLYSIRHSNIMVQKSNFLNNLATGSAACIVNFSGVNMIVDTCNFIANSAQFGGGINHYGDSLLINHCYFAHNKVTGAGGGGYFTGKKASINNSFFFRNEAISVDSLFGTGGGIQIASPTAEVEINNSVFSENSAGGKMDDGGGGIMIYGGKLKALNTTIVDNYAATIGGGIRIFDSTGVVQLCNTIIWNNRAPFIDFAGIANTGGEVEVNYSDLQNFDIMTGIGNMSTDPLFFNSADPLGEDTTGMTDDDGLTLQKTSPLINKGDPSVAFPVTDILGNNHRGIFDIGAYEYIPSTVDIAPMPENQSHIFPNPARNMIYLNENHPEKDIIIMNLTGQIIWRGRSREFPLDISAWSKGLYLIRIESIEGSFTHKLIKL